MNDALKQIFIPVYIYDVVKDVQVQEYTPGNGNISHKHMIFNEQS